MNQDKALRRNSVYYFILFFLLALWAFWPGYYGRLSERLPGYIHLHGSTMTLWCLALIGQALLIRLKKNKVHKRIGQLSYFLVLMIMISGFHAAHQTLKGVPAMARSGTYYATIALMFNSLIIFLVLYGLAIYHRKNVKLHARYMVSTIFPIITPLTDRLVYNHAPGLLAYVPTMEGRPIVWYVGFLLADLALISLIIMDWSRLKRIKAFPIVLGLVTLYHLSVLWFHNFGCWRSIGDWIMALPLS